METILSLNGSAERAVKKDCMILMMRAEQIENKALDAQQEVNKRMKKALEIVHAANKDQHLAVETAGYSVLQYQVYEDASRSQFEDASRRGKVKSDRWKAQQTVIISGSDTERLLKLATDLQGIGLLMNGINFTVSPNIVREIRQRLTAEALKDLQDRAKQIADDLSLKVGHFKTIVSEPSGGPLHFHTQATMMYSGNEAAGAAPIQAEGGEATITVTFGAEVVLTQ